MKTHLETALIKEIMGYTEFSEDVRAATASLIITEMNFRGPTYRSIEFIVVFLLAIVGQDISRFTVGCAQISIRHVHRIKSVTGVHAIIFLASPKNSFRLACAIVSECSSLDVFSVASHYNGQATPYYLRLLMLTRMRVESVWQAIR